MRVLSAAEEGRHGASFSLSNKLARVAWGVAWLAFARWTPPALHGWRRLVLRAFGAQVARGARVHASVRVWFPPNLSLGEGALIGPGAILYNQGRIEVGARAVVSQRAHLCASTHDLRDPNFQLVLRPIRLEREIWVGAEAFVGRGVTMGEGAVLGARGALFRNAERWTVYGGNPAVALKPRPAPRDH